MSMAAWLTCCEIFRGLLETRKLIQEPGIHGLVIHRVFRSGRLSIDGRSVNFITNNFWNLECMVILRLKMQWVTVRYFRTELDCSTLRQMLLLQEV